MSINSRTQFTVNQVTVHFRFSAHSDRGTVRRVNEDSFLANAPLFIVADGMGGHSFGDRASQTAIETFARALPVGEPAVANRVLETLKLANEAVLALSDEADGTPVVCGTTLAGLAFVDIGDHENFHWMTFNVGDSRVYSWDGRTLTQVSVDHSAVQELIDGGTITKGEAARHPERNIVTRALGAESEADADIWLLPARAHQTFLLCSDGLSKELDDDEIARIIVFHNAVSRETEGGAGRPDALDTSITLAERLVNAAIAAGGSDNITVVIVESDIIRQNAANRPEGEDDATVDREGMSRFLEETHPRG